VGLEYANVTGGSMGQHKEQLLSLLQQRKAYTLADVHAITDCLEQMGYKGDMGSGDLLDRWIDKLNGLWLDGPRLYYVIQEERDPNWRRNQAPASLWVAKPEYELWEKSTLLFEEMKKWLKEELGKEPT
jgi:hypothetical protein